MLRFISLLVACTLASACGQDKNPATAAAPAAAAKSAPQSESERLDAWFEARYEEQLRFSPIQLTLMGRKELYGQFDDRSEAGEDAQLDWWRGTVEEMQSEFDYERLTPEAQISYDIWKYQYEDAAANREFRGNQYVFTQMGGLHTFIPTVMSRLHRVEQPEDMEAYVERLGAAARALNQLIDRAQQYARQGVRPPRFTYEGVLEQARAVISGAPFDDGEDAALWLDAKHKIQALADNELVSTEEANALEDGTKRALLDEIKPAYERLIAWLRSDLQNTSDEARGVSSLPNGGAYYERRLAASTTTDMTADEIHELGLAEVRRLRGEMDAVREQVGFDGDLQAFFGFVRDDEQFYFPDTDAGRQAYIDEAERHLAFIDERLPEYFGVLPKAHLIVKRVEPFREQDGAAQHYLPGSPDGSRPGTYYVHLSDMTAMPRPQLEVIAYHEGNPGHHMQNSIAQESSDVPTFRTQTQFTAYGEGWGLYAELLALEMGAYDDPYSNYGRLGSEMWRALRLVVDTGLHSRGWSEQQAIEYMLQNSSEPFESVQSEVQRYLVLPGQATSYKVGMLKIQALRERAEKALGDRFDIRAFHDTLLTGGAMPLSVLERRVDNWIESIQARSALGSASSVATVTAE